MVGAEPEFAAVVGRHPEGVGTGDRRGQQRPHALAVVVGHVDAGFELIVDDLFDGRRIRKRGGSGQVRDAVAGDAGIEFAVKALLSAERQAGASENDGY